MDGARSQRWLAAVKPANRNVIAPVTSNAPSSGVCSCPCSCTGAWSPSVPVRCPSPNSGPWRQSKLRPRTPGSAKPSTSTRLRRALPARPGRSYHRANRPLPSPRQPHLPSSPSHRPLRRSSPDHQCPSSPSRRPRTSSPSRRPPRPSSPSQRRSLRLPSLSRLRCHRLPPPRRRRPLRVPSRQHLRPRPLSPGALPHRPPPTRARDAPTVPSARPATVAAFATWPPRLLERCPSRTRAIQSGPPCPWGRPVRSR